MKRTVPLCLLGIAGFVGCSVEDQSVATSAPAAVAPDTATAESADAMLIHLKVPNMH